MEDKKINWEQIKAEFLAGSTLKTLSEKYSISFSTLKSRHSREKWSNLRKKTEGKLQEKLVNEIAKNQAEKVLNAVEVIDKIVTQLIECMPNTECYSKESIAKVISDLLKVRGTYTGETTDKKELGINIVGEFVRNTIERLDEKGPRKFVDI